MLLDCFFVFIFIMGKKITSLQYLSYANTSFSLWVQFLLSSDGRNPISFLI